MQRGPPPQEIAGLILATINHHHPGEGVALGRYPWISMTLKSLVSQILTEEITRLHPPDLPF